MAVDPSIPGSDFPHPYVTVDVVLLTVMDGQLKVVTLERTEPPEGWALPGAFVHIEEDVDETARRILEEKLGFSRRPELPFPLPPFGAVNRDPRRRVITLPYVALVDLARFERRSPEDIDIRQELADVTLEDSNLRVEIQGQRCELVFDHAEILAKAVREIRRRLELDDPSVHVQLLPPAFTLRELQTVHEAVMGTRVNRDSFRRRALASGRLVETEERETAVGHRPAAFYRWNSDV